ncbi:hypothetical protein C8R43DRAFT_956316 [Mycena crocata]|nr:hypothetical protein C8R43DRAFT_956316 [Mycena crocata]
MTWFWRSGSASTCRRLRVCCAVAVAQAHPRGEGRTAELRWRVFVSGVWYGRSNRAHVKGRSGGDVPAYAWGLPAQLPRTIQGDGRPVVHEDSVAGVRRHRLPRHPAAALFRSSDGHSGWRRRDASILPSYILNPGCLNSHRLVQETADSKYTQTLLVCHPKRRAESLSPQPSSAPAAGRFPAQYRAVCAALVPSFEMFALWRGAGASDGDSWWTMLPLWTDVRTKDVVEERERERELAVEGADVDDTELDVLLGDTGESLLGAPVAA